MEMLNENVLLRERIIRRLSWRAGIVEMENDVYELTWGAIVKFIFMLVEPACLNLVCVSSHYETGFNNKRILRPGQTLRDVPPLPLFDNGRLGALYTAVPKQIEDAALSVVGSLRPHKVYGNGWLVSGAFDSPAERDLAVNQEIANAEARYEYEEESETEKQIFVMANMKMSDETSIDSDEMSFDMWSLAYENESDDDGGSAADSFSEEDERSMSEDDAHQSDGDLSEISDGEDFMDEADD